MAYSEPVAALQCSERPSSQRPWGCFLTLAFEWCTHARASFCMLINGFLVTCRPEKSNSFVEETLPTPTYLIVGRVNKARSRWKRIFPFLLKKKTLMFKNSIVSDCLCKQVDGGGWQVYKFQRVVKTISGVLPFYCFNITLWISKYIIFSMKIRHQTALDKN